MIENENTDNSSLSSLNSTEKKDETTYEKIMEEKESHYSILKVISEILTATCEQSKFDNEEKILLIKSFMTKKRPNISIYEFLKRLYKYGKVSESIFILVLIYIDRLCRLGKIILTCYNIHRILFTAVLLAIKYNEDNFFENEYYAKIAGVKNFELKNLEYNFFYKCNFDMYVDEETFGKYCKYINSNNNDNDDEENKIKKLFF